MQVPFFNYQALFPQHREAYLGIFEDVCTRGAFILQKDLTDFELELAKFAGARFAIGVADGTEALYLSLIAAGIERGDEVIIPSHTMVATVGPVHFIGAKPVLVDCGPDHLVDPASVEEAITPKTRAIMPVHVNGRCCNMEATMKIAERHKLKVVEDAAQALGARFLGRSAGTFGEAGTISFYPAKTLGCFGDGGAVLTNSEEIAKKVRLIRDHGRDEETGEILTWGLNSRLDNLQAAFLNHSIKHFPAVIEMRRHLASLYDAQLGDMEELVLPPAPGSSEEHFDTFQNYEIEAERRDELQAFLKQRGVGTLVQWSGKAVHQHKALKFSVSLPNTEKLFERCLMLPMNPFVSEGQLKYVCNQIKEFYN